MRILIVDTLYPDFLKSLSFDPNGTYEGELQKVLDRKFGTADFYSRNLKALGWDAVDVIANHDELQTKWCDENNQISGLRAQNKVLAQIQQSKPDVIFVQDLSFFNTDLMEHIGSRCLIAGQLSCPWPGDERVKQFDILYSSFPHYVPRIEALGVRAIYNPLAFESSVLDIFDWRASVEMAKSDRLPPRIHDCVFIGGVGNPSHWKYGMEVLETVAREIPTFKWWGYGIETLPVDSMLRQKYQGSAFGLDMYSILLQSKIALCRHGEVAEGYTNAMRVYESTGCGALMLTEESKNIWDLFSVNEVATYLTPAHAVEKIKYYLANEEERSYVAANGQARCLRDHTYAIRMKRVSDVLTEMLVGQNSAAV